MLKEDAAAVFSYEPRGINALRHWSSAKLLLALFKAPTLSSMSYYFKWPEIAY